MHKHINNNQTFWLTSVLYLFKIIGINLKPETGELHMFGENDTIIGGQKYIEEKV